MKPYALLLLAALGATPAAAALPDWSGVWVPNIPEQNAHIEASPPPWTPAAKAQIDFLQSEEKAGRPKGLFVNCLPEGMPSWMLISHNALEFLFTPGRVTLLGESDGNRLRRIYTDGRPHESDPDPSFFGDSVGHWEGQTLVVDTIAVFPETYVATGEAVGVPNNGDLHVAEHIHLLKPDLLADDLVITAPHVLTRPWSITGLFHRQPGTNNTIEEGVCLEGYYNESTDAKGNAVFVPIPQTEYGTPKPE